MNRELSRRTLLKALAALASGAGLWKASSPLLASRGLPSSSLKSTSATSFLPLVHRVQASPKVVHVHAPAATSWSGQTDYWNYVDQAVVDNMVDQGVMALTGTSSVARAWQAILPSYQVGQGIAIKVNLNNSWECGNPTGKIDALIQPVNAVVRGLKHAGVVEADIWVYDAIRAVPDYLLAGSQYAGIRFFDSVCRNPAEWHSNDPDALVSFDPPPGTATPPDTRVTDVLINATYLINMPIIKKHFCTGVSLAFKNHFGSIDKPSGLHPYTCVPNAAYSALVDLYRNPHIVAKTVLILGDGLFGARAYHAAPEPWVTFANQPPESLFFATDPVAIDCVMCDFVHAEFSVASTANDYLRLASDAGLGVFERGDPWGSGYGQIAYLRTEL